MIILDIDGVLLENGKIEKLIRRYSTKKMRFSSPPRFCFFMIEILEIIFKIKQYLKPEAKKFIRWREKNIIVGIFTDRSILSVERIFQSNGFSLESIDFLQTRKSFLNKFSLWPKIINYYFNKPYFYQSKKIKPWNKMLDQIELFALTNNIKPEEILIVDDLEEVHLFANHKGFNAAFNIPQDIIPSFLTLY